MPGLDGIEMTKRIREINSDAFVMALTACSDSDWKARSGDLDFNHRITKPVEFAPLLAAVGAAIESATSRKKNAT